MTRREKYQFILAVILPELERDGLTIKTRTGAEFSLTPDDQTGQEFITALRSRMAAALERAPAFSPYGYGS
ncbi:TPA: hypothetical protein L9L56_004462 [Klebsiella pneumoniae]|uniref:hypothetical protein n=1 Tax=Klebsiella pneumoniae TaxID=573 RepID=UPI000E2ED5D8|nr:hypothetical protein [Klebsiella pneumoniae]HBR1366638.1 hypothetical protein [Klebsiella pneumoniae]HBR2015035.1 hypothetical protein [Klebsiella pneumoniae]